MIGSTGCRLSRGGAEGGRRKCQLLHNFGRKEGERRGEKRREIEGKTVWRVYTSGQTGCPQLVRGREMKGGDSKSKRTCSRRVVRRCVAIKEDTKRGVRMWVRGAFHFFIKGVSWRSRSMRAFTMVPVTLQRLTQWTRSPHRRSAEHKRLIVVEMLRVLLRELDLDETCRLPDTRWRAGRRRQTGRHRWRKTKQARKGE